MRLINENGKTVTKKKKEKSGKKGEEETKAIFLSDATLLQANAVIFNFKLQILSFAVFVWGYEV